MTIRNWFSLLLLPALLAALSSSIWGADPPSGPEDAVLRKGKSGNMHLYENRYFRLRMEVPGNWHVLLNKELVWFIHDPNMRRAIKEGLCFPLLAISKYRPGKPGPKGECNSNIFLSAEKLFMYLPVRIETARDYIEELKKAGMKFRSKPSVKKVGKIEVWSFDVATAAVPGDRYAHVVAVRDGFLLRFTLTGESKADIEELRDIMKSLHFD